MKEASAGVASEVAARSYSPTVSRRHRGVKISLTAAVVSGGLISHPVMLGGYRKRTACGWRLMALYLLSINA